MIDLNGYTREAIQKAMLDRVPRTLDTRGGSVIQTGPGDRLPGIWRDFTCCWDRSSERLCQHGGRPVLDYICAERGIRRKEASGGQKEGNV